MIIERKLIICTASLIVMLMIEIKKRREKIIKKKRLWTKKWIEKRGAGKGILNMLNEELLVEDPLAYRNYLRMNNTTFEKLLGLLSNKIKKQDTQFRESISARCRFVRHNYCLHAEIYIFFYYTD
ncbi:hypothetical protein ABEB36_010773 [Hypothenemus hampei]|uniref:Uncharacterized protein n=1 Tax=Hypothenemus hampei TaxID=57062 RepID=A0ABD1ED35_HYPHA